MKIVKGIIIKYTKSYKAESVVVKYIYSFNHGLVGIGFSGSSEGYVISTSRKGFGAISKLSGSTLEKLLQSCGKISR